MEPITRSFSPENPPSNPRTVEQLLYEGKTPLLSFEVEILKERLANLGIEQKDLARLLGEAMSQSSETWHDNAPADAINHDSKRITNQAEAIIASIRSGVEIKYPSADEETVTVGTVVALSFFGDEPEKYLMTGTVRTLDGEMTELLDGVLAVTVQSPLGRALLGATAGDTVAYEGPNGRKISVDITDLAQLTDA